jgi:hypothetical protein
LSILGPNILLNTLFSNTLSLCSSLTVSDQNHRQNYSNSHSFCLNVWSQFLLVNMLVLSTCLHLYCHEAETGLSESFDKLSALSVSSHLKLFDPQNHWRTVHSQSRPCNAHVLALIGNCWSEMDQTIAHLQQNINLPSAVYNCRSRNKPFNANWLIKTSRSEPFKHWNSQ